MQLSIGAIISSAGGTKNTSSAKCGYYIVAFRNDRDHFSFARFYLLDITHYFFMIGIFGSYKYYGQSVCHQCDRAVFHFCSGVTFCMDVTDLLQALKRLPVQWESCNHGQGIRHRWHLYIFQLLFLRHRRSLIKLLLFQVSQSSSNK